MATKVNELHPISPINLYDDFQYISDYVTHPIQLEVANTQARGLFSSAPILKLKADSNKTTNLFDNTYFSMRDLLENLKLAEQNLFLKGVVAWIVQPYTDSNNAPKLRITPAESVLFEHDIMTSEIKSVTTSVFIETGRETFRLEETWTSMQVTRQVFTWGQNYKQQVRAWDIVEFKNSYPNIEIEPLTNHNLGYIPVLIYAPKKDFTGKIVSYWDVARPYIKQLSHQEQQLNTEILKRATKLFGNSKLDDGGNNSEIDIPAKLLSSYFLTLNNSQDTGQNSMISWMTDDNHFIEYKLQAITYFRTRALTAMGYSDLESNDNTSNKTTDEISMYRENTISTLKSLSTDRTLFLQDLFELILRGLKSLKVSEVDIDDLDIACTPYLYINEEAKLDYLIKQYNAGVLKMKDFVMALHLDWNNKDYEEWIVNNYDNLNARIANFNLLSTDTNLDQAAKLKYLFGDTLDEANIQKLIANSANEKPQNPFNNNTFDPDAKPPMLDKTDASTIPDDKLKQIKKIKMK